MEGRADQLPADWLSLLFCPESIRPHPMARYEEAWPKGAMSLRSFSCSLNGEEESDPMADLANRYPENVPGRYYVDDQCIDCDLCRQSASNNFKRDEKSGHSYVFNQPQTSQEEAQCEEAIQGCPVEAIGNDGDLARKLDAKPDHAPAGRG